VVVVWGPERDTLTAAEEIRLRYVDAVDGIPNETRQPFPDGSTDFERILPGPDRMYPDTDSPPIEVTRERVEGLRATLAPPPWDREERYSAAGVPRSTIFYLIRRNGAALVDRIVEECGTDLRQACFFFGERLKGLGRRGVAVGSIDGDRWCELFRLFGERPATAEAWKAIVSRMAAEPDSPVDRIVEQAGLARPSGDWHRVLEALVEARRPDHDDGSPEQRIRFYMGSMMDGLRGRVPAREIRTRLEQVVGRAT
jgi:glutamyl-tRNA(Gln) amidotransferase subunit E